MKTAFELSRVEGNKALGVLCSDGRRRNARLYFDNPWTDSEKTAASVKVNGQTVMGFVQQTIREDDFIFAAFRDGRNANLLPHLDATKYVETHPIVYVVIQYMPPYMPSDDDPPVFLNRKDAERCAADEKKRYLDDMWDEETDYHATGSAREGLVVIYDRKREHDLGWAIEIIEQSIADFSAEERKEMV